MKLPTPNHNFSSNIRLVFSCRKILILTLIGILSSCRSSAPKTTNPQIIKSMPEQTPEVLQGATVTSATTSAPEALATISEIQSQPVWLRRLKALSEISAQPGMGVQIGETIRTEGNAMAQINLKNGLAFRIGGDAVLTLQADNRLNLKAGEMITWVTPGKKVPTQVITPGGVAGIRGTTIYIKMPKNPQDAIEFFTWEGTMFIKLPNKTEEFQLKAGEIVKIKPGETNLSKIRASVRPLTSQEWSNRRRNNPLINKFDKPLPTLKEIDKTDPSLPKISTSNSSLTPSSSPQNLPALASVNEIPKRQNTPEKVEQNLKYLPEEAYTK